MAITLSSITLCHFEDIYFLFIHLEVLYAELVTIHVNGREEDGFHLVMS